jgi:hypothetical protein
MFNLDITTAVEEMPDGPYGQCTIQVQHTPTVVPTEPLKVNMSPSEHKSHVSIKGKKSFK